MLWPIVAILVGIVVLLWSADRFVDGAASTARHFEMPPLLIGMVIVGFGTSAPEMVVSGLAAWQGNSGLALGNAYGSNITNIALILGVTAMISPILVRSRVLRKELPMLAAVTGLAIWQVWDGEITRSEAAVLLAVFVALMGWTIWQGMRKRPDAFADEMEQVLQLQTLPLKRAILWLILGLLLLVVSSRILVWGAVEIATALGVSDLVIGLTVVAIGTSLPELASSLVATRKGEHDIALGNVLGSNLFNTLAVVGIAGAIEPISFGSEVLYRDVMVMSGLTLSLFLAGFGWSVGRAGRITRLEGALLVLCYIAYTTYLVITARGG